MWTPETDESKVVAVLKNVSPADKLGAIAAATGIVLVVFGIVLQEHSGVSFGATIRTLGGVLFLGGLGTVLFSEPQRRAAIIGAARRIVERYMDATVTWRRTDRLGLAGVAVGLALAAPAVVMQFLFGGVFGSIVVTPGVLLFWVGVALLVYGRFHRRDARSNPPPSRSGWRDSDRGARR